MNTLVIASGDHYRGRALEVPTVVPGVVQQCPLGASQTSHNYISTLKVTGFELHGLLKPQRIFWFGDESGHLLSHLQLRLKMTHNKSDYKCLKLLITLLCCHLQLHPQAVIKISAYHYSDGDGER